MNEILLIAAGAAAIMTILASERLRRLRPVRVERCRYDRRRSR